MLVSCSYCSGFHTRGVSCPKKPKLDSRKKEETFISRFRSSRLWKNKRDEIKARDLFLCRTCFEKGTYVWSKLSVHHISPISKAWDKRLENGNLITLCATCHKMSEDGNIKASYLLELAQNQETRFKPSTRP